MRYLRTRKGIIDLSTKEDVDGNELNDITFYDPMLKAYFVVKSENVVNMSDNLEDLCDCFIYEYFHFESETVKRKMFYKTSEFSNYAIDFKNGLEKVYGAIFIKDGIKYVTKMNEDRKLELL